MSEPRAPITLRRLEPEQLTLEIWRHAPGCIRRALNISWSMV